MTICDSSMFKEKFVVSRQVGQFGGKSLYEIEHFRWIETKDTDIVNSMGSNDEVGFGICTVETKQYSRLELWKSTDALILGSEYMDQCFSTSVAGVDPVDYPSWTDWKETGESFTETYPVITIEGKCTEARAFHRISLDDVDCLSDIAEQIQDRME